MDFIVLLKYSFITLKTKVKITSALSRMSRMVRKLNEGKVMCKKIFILCIKLRTTCKFGYTLNRDDYKQQRWDHH